MTQHAAIYVSEDFGISWTHTPSQGKYAAIWMPNSVSGGVNVTAVIDGLLHQSQTHGLLWQKSGQAPVFSDDDSVEIVGDLEGITLFYCSRMYGLYRSSDRGVSWSTVLNGGMGCVGVSTDASATFVSMVSVQNNAIYASQDSGNTWSVVSPVTSTSDISLQTIA